jgi:oligoendopeptidase F
MKDNDPNKLYLMALDNFWSSYEIMGVAMVDMNVWKWLYANPNASAVQLKEAVISIAKEIWNKYYADVFGIKDQPILAIYSHMIDNPLYLSNYPIGHLIDLQIDKYVEGKKFGEEIPKMLVMGSVIPQEWMIKAVGAKISIEPTLQAASEALKYIK